LTTLKSISSLFTKYFTFWIIGFSILAYIYPESLAKLAYLVTTTLGLIMFGMGVTLVSTAAIIFIVGVTVAANAETIEKVGLKTGIAVVLHNVLGVCLGFYLARLTGMEMSKARAVSIEVGMQNSGLGVALANAHFGPLAALPSAMFSVWHNIFGSVLAWLWRRKDNNSSATN